MKKNIILTGCCGFIGSNFVKKIATDKSISEEFNFVILDSITYAGHYKNIEKEIINFSHLTFHKIDLRNFEDVQKIFLQYLPVGVIHFAAESHVDRSIENPNIFIETNVIGTLNLLNSSLMIQKEGRPIRYLQVSTDEVYGQLTEDEPAFTESHPITPNSPYSASKASADLLVNSFHHTFGLDTIITRCSNNYGPYQHPEKFIPVIIRKSLENAKIPVYGNGTNIRDWIYVDDHNEGVWQAFKNGKSGEVYNFGGQSEKRNIDVVNEILNYLELPSSLLEFVTDRLGHDFRYAIDISKVQKELNWNPKVPFSNGIKQTINWYQNNQNWVQEIQNKNECQNY